MPLELGVWRIDDGLKLVPHKTMDSEKRLEDVLERDISVIAPHLMIIGRQVATSLGKFVDLLAIDGSGNLAVIELKRDQTPRDVVAQVLDYGSWVRDLEAETIASIWQRYVEAHRPDLKGRSLDEAFRQRFSLKEMPEELNAEHALIVVASSLDESTERIVNYLAGDHGVNINVLFFRLFSDGDREYLTRVWLRDPTEPIGESTESPKGSWNGEYYVSFGGGRNWKEAVEYGFISGGGGTWFSNTLLQLSEGDRVWVNIPGTGYVGVGIVEAPRVQATDFMVKDKNGKEVPITELPLDVAKGAKMNPDPELTEYLVRVRWLKTVDEEQAIKETGFFGNQNTVARPKTPKWDFTVSRLKQVFGIQD